MSKQPITLAALAEEAERVRAQVAASPEGGVLTSIDFAAFALRWYDTLVKRAQKMAKAAAVVHDATHRIARDRCIEPRNAAHVEPIYRTMPECFRLVVGNLETKLDTEKGRILALLGGEWRECGWVTADGIVYGGNHVEPLTRSQLIDAWQEAIDVARQLARPGVQA